MIESNGERPTTAGIGLTELHRHLDGALRPSTVESLAAKLNVPCPKSLYFEPGMGLAEALAKFAFTVSLLQQPGHLTRVADEICADATLEGIEHLEIRFAPQLHHQMSMARAVDAVLEGCGDRAGLILCGLYGEPPAVLEALVNIAMNRPRVVGIDLAGGPTPQHRYGLRDYAPAFKRARRLDLGRTVHAGEGRPAYEIRAAVEHLFAQRIGHGVTLLDDPELLDLVCANRVTIEACPTSNVHTGAISAIEVHPLRQWLNHGVRVAVCTDNPLFSQVDLPAELRRIKIGLDLSAAEMSELQRHAATARFETR
ncbi:MAG: hypothetical protein VX589_03300 [Myxococcota bacterium]|nr:hypothetical protein [Myxococcota bacterium]